MSDVDDDLRPAPHGSYCGCVFCKSETAKATRHPAPRRARRPPKRMPDGEKDQMDYAWNEPGAPFRSGDY